MFSLFQTLFNLLPLATRINNEVLVVHGGLCRTGNATLDQLRAVDRKRPVPVSTTDPKDLLFFDTMWADPQEAPGISRSVARGSVCVTFGPDVTRRFCEINRLRMIIRSHEVPRSMSGVAVQHDGRLITVFSASNYCGRIGNTGGTMLLTPSLDYQLMEHWCARANPHTFAHTVAHTFAHTFAHTVAHTVAHTFAHTVAHIVAHPAIIGIHAHGLQT